MFWIGLELFGTAGSWEEGASEIRIAKFYARISLAPSADLRVLLGATQLAHHGRRLVLAAAPLYKREPCALRISKLVRPLARFNIPHRTGVGQGGKNLGGEPGVSCARAAAGGGRAFWLLA